MAFHLSYPVRYGSVDYARIVYYPQFLHFCHIAMEEMFAAEVGIHYGEALIQENVGYPTVTSNAEFLSPVPYGTTLDISVAVERIGTSSVDFRYEGRLEDKTLAFRVRNTQIAVDMEAWKSTPIPAHHREAFVRLHVDATTAND